MSFNWADTRARVRQTVADTFGLKAQYRESDTSPTLDVSARLHYKVVEVEHEGFMRADQEIWIWLQLDDVPSPVVDAAIHIESTGDDFLIERIMPATDISIPVVVREA